MASKNCKCLSCGIKYSYCPSCSRADALEPSWKSEFCSETCMTLWSTLTKYNMGFLTKSEAKDIVLNLNIKSIDTYANCVQRDYSKLVEEEKKSRKFTKKIAPVVKVEPIEIEQPIEEAIEVAQTIIHEVVLEEKE